MATLKVTNIKNESFAGDQLYLKTDGRLGIGITAPSRDMVHIHNPTANASNYIQFTNTNTSGTGINDGTLIGISQNNSNTDGTGSAFTILQKENAEITLGTNNDERLRITSAGRVLIGTTSEGHSNADDLTLATAAGALGNTGITIRSSTTGDGNIFFSDATSGDGETKGVIKYSHNGDSLKFNTAGQQRLEINSDGDIEVGGNLKANNFSSERNVIINGGMQISQRGSDWTSVAASAYHLDRWYYYTQNSSAQVRIRHSGDGPNNFHQSYRINCTTEDDTIASNEEIKVIQKIEGFNVQQFEKGTSTAKKFALSFYIKCNKNGTYIVELYDRDNGRDCSGSYTISDNNWNKHTIEFPADTTGGFDFDHAASLEIQFWLVAGSAVQGGSLNTTWRTSADSGSATGQVNFTDDTSNEWMLTGVQLEPSVCTEFNHKLYKEDLALCQRYYQIHQKGSAKSFGLGYGYNASEIDVPVRFVTTMRSDPTLDQVSGADFIKLVGGAAGAGSNVDGSWTIQLATEHGGNLYATPDATITAGSAYMLRSYDATCEWAFNAEL